MRRIVFVLLVTGCGADSAHPVANHAAAPRGTLGDSLARDIGAGRAVAIVGGPDGIVAISSDGARQRSLLHEPVPWVVVDAHANVIWFGSADRTTMRAIDLEQPASTSPVVHDVVTHLPPPNRVEMVGPVYFGVAYPQLEPGEPLAAAMFSAERYALGDSLANASITLDIMTEPLVSGSSGYQRDEAWDASIKQAVIADRELVLAFAARKSHRGADPPLPPETRVTGVDASACENPDECGRAQPIPGTHDWRVLVGHVTGDVAHFSYRLYDADAKRFVDGEWATWLSNMSVAPDGAAFVVDGVVVRFDRGPLAATHPRKQALGGGWLGGGTQFGM